MELKYLHLRLLIAAKCNIIDQDEIIKHITELVKGGFLHENGHITTKGALVADRALGGAQQFLEKVWKK